jgi:hypothetical protein
MRVEGDGMVTFACLSEPLSLLSWFQDLIQGGKEREAQRKSEKQMAENVGKISCITSVRNSSGL